MSVGPPIRIEGLGFDLEIAPFTLEDCLAMLPYMTFSTIRYTMIRSGMTKEDEEKWYKTVVEDPKRFLWGVYVTKDGERVHVGNTEVRLKNDKSATTGIILHRKDYWGMGIASHTHLARTMFAADVLDVLSISSEVAEPNEGSWRALERVGYCHDGTEYDWFVREGRVIPVKRYYWVNPEEVAWQYFWRGINIPEPRHAARQHADAALQKARQITEFV